MLTAANRLALLMSDGYLRSRNGKMGYGLMRYSDNPITCVVASDEVGGSVRDITGIDVDVPIVATAEDAHALGADTLVIAVATSGGVLPPPYRVEIVSAS